MAPVLLNPYRFGGGGGGSDTLAAAMMADSPVNAYLLGDASGSVMVDSSGGGHDGTYVNSPTLGAASLLTSGLGTSVDFNGTSQGAYGPIGAYANFTTFSVEALIRPDVVSGTRVIACRQSGGNLVWTLRLEGTALKFYHWNAAGSLQGPVTSSATFSAGVVAHVGFAFVMSTSYAFYVNGSVAGSGTPSSTLQSNNIGLQVAASSGGTAERFDGRMSHVGYYNAALSAGRWAAHAAAA